ncbi:hypothetical protein CAXC1_220070 [Candidatus Xenohaliotis californiensis]|uniref:Uncharacterized protein n=1 Tax=Candidatus Xenohaliotis californiensis TaxID=84677 RepID=A0ABP0EVS7_9RICK|nr:hypothetical protein CAXC1_220070 [Candidatus Xenohaliotis californiensis]
MAHCAVILYMVTKIFNNNFNIFLTYKSILITSVNRNSIANLFVVRVHKACEIILIKESLYSSIFSYS